jgi:hypothetical protein
MPAPPSPSQTAAKNAVTTTNYNSGGNTKSTNVSKSAPAGTNPNGGGGNTGSQGGVNKSGPGSTGGAKTPNAASKPAAAKPAAPSKPASPPKGGGGGAGKGPAASLAAAKVNAAAKTTTAKKPAAPKAPASNKFGSNSSQSGAVKTQPKSIQGMINNGFNGTQPRDSQGPIPSNVSKDQYGWVGTGKSRLAAHQGYGIYGGKLASQGEKFSQDQYDTMLRSNTVFDPKTMREMDSLPPTMRRHAGILSAAARFRDVPLKTALGMGAIESKFGTIKDRPKSQYQGLTQIGNWEFNNYADDVSKQLGKLNPWANAQAGVSYMGHLSDRYQKKFDRAPTTGDVYGMYNQGYGGYTSLRANPDALASDVVGLSHVRENLPGRLRGRAGTITAGEFANIVAAHPSRAYAGIVGSPQTAVADPYQSPPVPNAKTNTFAAVGIPAPDMGMIGDHPWGRTTAPTQPFSDAGIRKSIPGYAPPTGFSDAGIKKSIPGYSPPPPGTPPAVQFSDAGIRKPTNTYTTPSIPMSDAGIRKPVNPYSAPGVPLSDEGIRKTTNPYAAPEVAEDEGIPDGYFQQFSMTPEDMERLKKQAMKDHSFTELMEMRKNQKMLPGFMGPMTRDEERMKQMADRSPPPVPTARPWGPMPDGGIRKSIPGFTPSGVPFSDEGVRKSIPGFTPSGVPFSDEGVRKTIPGFTPSQNMTPPPGWKEPLNLTPRDEFEKLLETQPGMPHFNDQGISKPANPYVSPPVGFNDQISKPANPYRPSLVTEDPLEMANPETAPYDEDPAPDEYSENPIQGPSNPSQEPEDPRVVEDRRKRYRDNGSVIGGVIAGPIGAIIGGLLGDQMGKTTPGQRQAIANNPAALHANVNSINLMMERGGGPGRKDPEFMVTVDGFRDVLNDPDKVLEDPESYTTLEEMLAALAKGIDPATGKPI